MTKREPWVECPVCGSGGRGFTRGGSGRDPHGETCRFCAGTGMVAESKARRHHELSPADGRQKAAGEPR